jgi:hypothetical protein
MGNYKLFALGLLAAAALVALGTVTGPPATSARELDRVPVLAGE